MDSRSSTPEPLGPRPFDNGSADIVLQSCDGVDFHVLRSILSKASPFFDGMFMLPLPQRCDSEIEDDAIPTVPMSEDSETLDTLLRMCYPVQPPSLDELWHVERVVEASRKYEMDWALQSAEQALMRIAKTDPLGVYATACRFGLRDAARVSARYTLRLPVSTVIETLMQHQ